MYDCTSRMKLKKKKRIFVQPHQPWNIWVSVYIYIHDYILIPYIYTYDVFWLRLFTPIFLSVGVILWQSRFFFLFIVCSISLVWKIVHKFSSTPIQSAGVYNTFSPILNRTSFLFNVEFAWLHLQIGRK